MFSKHYQIWHLHLAFKAPRFPGFITGNLSKISEVVTIPPHIYHFGSHACFGYRVLGESFKSLTETFQTIVELCGTPDFSCPCFSHSPSPDLDPIPLSPPAPKPHSIITLEDYVDSEEQVNELLAKLQQEEISSRPSCSSVNLIN